MLKVGKKLILILAMFGALLGFAACTQASNVVRIKLEATEYEINVGESIKIEPIIVKGSEVSEVVLGYQSSNEKVATFKDGVLTALSAGTTTIKVYDVERPLAYATAEVTVTNVESLNATFVVDTEMFEGEEQNITCELALDSANSIVTYVSANPEVASVDAEGHVIAHSAGTAIIVARVTSSVVPSEYRDYAFNVEVIEADYVIKYELDGGVNHPENPGGYNVLELPLLLQEPTKEGYKFLGWYIDGEQVEAIAAGTVGNITVVAKWERSIFPISYDTDGGENAAENLAEFGVLDLPLTLQPATRPGYKFLGWYEGETKVETITELRSVSVVAKWEIENYQISTELNGGTPVIEADLANAKLMQEFVLTDYLQIASATGFEAALDNKLTGRWWSFVVLKETEVKGLYEIKQIVAGSTKVTEEYDYVITWHSALTDATTKATLDKMLNNAATYVGQYVVFEGVPAEQTGDCSISAKVYDKSTVAITGELPSSYTINDEVALPRLEKVGYTFLGWFDGETKVEKIEKGSTGAKSLVAKFEVIPTKSPVEFELNGGLCENLPTEYVEGTALALPTPTKDGHEFGGWYLNAELTGDPVTEISATQTGAVKLYAKWTALAPEIKSKIEFELNGGSCENLPTEYVEGVALVLPTPTYAGHVFNGWFDNAELTGEPVTEISASQTGDVKLYASWTESSTPVKDLVVDPSDSSAYSTVAEAIAAASAGDTIIVKAGRYEGFTIDKSLTLKGANAGRNAVDGNRLAESIVTSDIVVAANNVVIDGFELTGSARVVGGEQGCSDVTITNMYVFESTVNPDSSASATAPVYFASVDQGVYYQNISLTNSKYEASTGRPMIFYGSQIINLTIKNNYFTTNASKGNYNDGIKIDSKGEFGVKGNVVIQSNYFNKFYQYVIWFMSYAEGTYNVIDNEFIDNGQTAASHCAVRFDKYVGAADGKVEINFQYNTVNNSYMLFRHEDTACTNLTLNVNYNKLLNCLANLWIKNSSTVLANAANNYYDSEPVGSKFTGVSTFEPYYKDINEVPVFVNQDNSKKINYELNGGELPEGAPTQFDSEKGLTSLPVPTNGEMIFLGWYNDGVKVDSIPAGTDSDVTLEARWREDALYVGASEEDYVYATLAEALAVAEAGDKIILLAGEYTENITLSVPNLTIAGPNQGVSGSAKREAEAVIKGVVTIDAAAQYLTIDGLAFTGAAQVVYGSTSASYNGFTFVNNRVYDTKEATAAWDTSRYTADAFILFRMSNSSQVAKNFSFMNNEFVNVSENNIIVNRALNATFDHNVFRDFDRNAIRFEGGYVYGMYSFTNNIFEQTQAENGNSAIFFRSIAGAANSSTSVVVEGNTFKNIGSPNAANPTYTGVISVMSYQENPLTWSIKNNVFDHCYDYLFLRNNGGNANIWSATIENNQFLGLPHSFYFASYSGSDTETSNPHLAVFNGNYYEDNDGKVITDLTQYASYFKHLKSYGTALAAKPGFEEAVPYEMWNIRYVLNGGETRGQFVYNYDSLNNAAIALPVLTKPNHNFVGWELNGQYVTEIPASVKGNLVLKAVFQVLEGEVYNITFVTEKGDWPTRDAYDREEILNAFFADLYEWAQSNGETRGYDAYVEDIKAKLAAYSDIKLRNTELGEYPDETGSTEYFLNVPKYYERWIEFFRIFRDAMKVVNAQQDFFKDTYATMVRLNQFVTWSSTGQGYFESSLPKMYKAVRIEQEKPTTYRGGQIVVLPQLTLKNGLAFLGWYDNPECTGEAITQIISTDTGDKTFYALWAQETIATEVKLNEISSIKRYEEYQLEWSFVPSDVTNQDVEFFSSNESVATVSNLKGLITAHANGTTTITMKVYGNRALDKSFELTVYSPDYIKGSYETVSYVNTGESINLIAEIVPQTTTEGTIVWESLDPQIATVDGAGKVTGVAKGNARIVAKDSTASAPALTFVVTVLDGTESEVIKFIVQQNNSNIFTSYQLSIGGDRNEDIYSSVNKILFNDALDINESKLEAGNADSAKYIREQYKSGVEFITVHYTAGFPSSSTALANANYFVTEGNVSIHYTTGNDGIYHCLDDKLYGAWHAGDSGSRYHSNSDQSVTLDGTEYEIFSWLPTGVKYDGSELLDVNVTASDDFYYELNGVKTTVKLPTTWDYSSRGTNHVYNADGTISSTSAYKGGSFSNRPVEEFFNDQDFALKVIDGYYYMAPTWWNFSQVYEGRICNMGGNINSIGIESCVNRGSDLWWTWQRTARLVAKLMEDNNLGIERVKGHHFFDGKNCPQPMLENDLEIWYEFIELVEAEYDLRTKYADAEISFATDYSDMINQYGRVANVSEYGTVATYTVTVTLNGKTETITLASYVPGVYEK